MKAIAKAIALALFATGVLCSPWLIQALRVLLE